MTGLDEWLQSRSRRRATLHRTRTRRALQSLSAMTVTDGDQTWVNFSSNDYLGLANHPDIAAALSRAAMSAGTGSGASALVTGYHPAHQALERELAEFLERDAALLCGSGYMANLAVITSLVGRKDRIIQDRLCHASLIDAARLSGAKLKRYPHRDVAGMERQLRGNGRSLMVTDGVFSMDGDIAPLPDMTRLAAEHAATLVVDDAHGIGVLGPGGRGVVALAGLDQSEAPVLVGTLGKAFGCSGAFIAGGNALIEHLVNEARTYIFTTAMAPAMAEAARRALRLVIDGQWRRDRVAENTERFREGAVRLGIELSNSASPIQPVPIGDERRALEVSAALRGLGFLVIAIRPPTVPRGSSRLRVTLSGAHSPDQVTGLVEALAECLQR